MLGVVFVTGSAAAAAACMLVIRLTSTKENFDVFNLAQNRKHFEVLNKVKNETFKIN